MEEPIRTLGPYKLLKKIGRGAFGVVWLAERQTAIAATQFALKRPRDEDIDHEAFKQEAQIWLRASGHENVVSLIEADIYDGQIVIISEYVPDGSLTAWLEKHGGRAPSIEAACRMIDGVLAGLAHLHERRIIHRDLKPDNILLRRETPRLADFGIARLLRSGSYSTNISGTLPYMAPEAFDGKRNERTDIWSVGVIFYQLLVGNLPYTQQDTASLVGAIMRHDPPPLPESVPKVLRRIVMKALQRESAQRYASAEEMRHDLREAERLQWLEQHNIRKTLPTVIKEQDVNLTGLEETMMPASSPVEVLSKTVADTRQASDGETRVAAASANPQATIKAEPEIFGIRKTPERPTQTSRFRRRGVAALAILVFAVLFVSGIYFWRSSAGWERESAGRDATPNPTLPGLSQRASPQPAATAFTNEIGMAFTLIPAGEFRMGSNSSDASDEKPAHQVRISNAFYMGKYEVSQKQWHAVMGTTLSEQLDKAKTRGFLEGEGDDYPMYYVSWNDAQEFINRLNAMNDGYSYRLPTEAEWEYACRAETTGEYAGDLDSMAWYSKELSLDNRTHPIGQKKGNKFGLYDMHGNVWEWCEDLYHDTYTGAPDDGSAWLNGGVEKSRVLRGGSSSEYAKNVRSAVRRRNSPEVPHDFFTNYGFRLAAVVRSQ